MENKELFSEQDIVYYSTLSESDLQDVIQQMTILQRGISGKYEKIKSAPWYKRALQTLSGKLKKTQQEIAMDQATLSAYCFQIVGEFEKRHMIERHKIVELQEQVNELYGQFTRFAYTIAENFQKTGNLFELLFGFESEKYSESTKSALEIALLLSNIERTSEVYHMALLTVQKKVSTEKRTLAKWLLTLGNASDEDILFYKHFVVLFPGEFAQVIELCLEFLIHECLDEHGIIRILETLNYENLPLTMSEFIDVMLM